MVPPVGIGTSLLLRTSRPFPGSSPGKGRDWAEAGGPWTELCSVKKIKSQQKYSPVPADTLILVDNHYFINVVNKKKIQ